MLCFRCEHRAMFLENGHRPRSQCGDIEESMAGCYMFQPCRPVLTKPEKHTKRPRFAAPIISKREYAVRVLDPEQDKICLGIVYKKGQQVALGWKPIVESNEERSKK